MNRLLSPPTLVCALACALPAIAAETPNYADDTLSGDWGGARGAMYQKGVALDIGTKIDLLRNMGGGIEKGGRAISHLDIKLKADFEKLAGWPGASGYVNFIQDHGGKLNAQQVGSWTGVSNIEVPINTHRLFHAWVQQEFADGRGALLVGIYPIDSEFQVVETGGLFLQPPYGPTADLALTRGPSIFNNSAFGLRAKWSAADRSAYVMAAVLDGIPGDPTNPRGTHVKFNRGDGSMSIVEIGLMPAEAGHVFEPASEIRGEPQAPELKAHETAERVEKYAAGLWRYSSRVADQLDASINRLSWGWYALAERTLFQAENGRDLAGFLRISGTDGDSTPIKTTVNVGVRVKVPLPGRDDDVFGLAYTHAALSGRWRAAQTFDTTAFESAWEATYRIQARKWLAVQPVMQVIRHPGGVGSRATARILGARIEISW